MTFRIHALIATFAVLGLSLVNTLSAQPIPPPRAPNNAFGNFFTPGYGTSPNGGMYYGGPFGGWGGGGGGIGMFGGVGGMGFIPGAGGFGGFPGFGGVGGFGGFGGGFGGFGGMVGPYGRSTSGIGTQSSFGPFAPYVLNMQPVLFNNRGHWYSNYYGHWYPNGLANGSGVLTNGGRGGGLALLSGQQGPGTIGMGGGPASSMPGILGSPPGQGK